MSTMDERMLQLMDVVCAQVVTDSGIVIDWNGRERIVKDECEIIQNKQEREIWKIIQFKSLGLSSFK